MAQGGDSDGYWLYPTRSNIKPNSRDGSATDPNSANYFYDDGIANGYNGGYAVNNSVYYPPGISVEDVGAFSVAASFYGTFDQAGNVWEWNETVIGSSCGVRGGSWDTQGSKLTSSYRYQFPPQYGNYDLGIRIVMIPEPTVVGLMASGIALLAWKRRRTF